MQDKLKMAALDCISGKYLDIFYINSTSKKLELKVDYKQKNTNQNNEEILKALEVEYFDNKSILIFSTDKQTRKCWVEVNSYKGLRTVIEEVVSYVKKGDMTGPQIIKEILGKSENGEKRGKLHAKAKRIGKGTVTILEILSKVIPGLEEVSKLHHINNFLLNLKENF